jgi:dipeptidyl-peptidase-4
MSPDGKQKAFHRDRNLFLSDAEGKNEVAITTEGNAKDRTKFGVASWVYGEELNVREAMWWKPDGTKLAFYGFDESKVPDFFLAMDQTKLYTTVDTEAYPKAGSPNPLVTLYLLDVASMARTVIDTKFADPTLDEYIYDVRWSPAGDELYFNRTNRKQNHMQFCAADPATGKCRVIIDESQPNSWVENSPPIRWLKDQKRFLWMSERNGFQNLYLYDVSGKLLSTLTKHEFEVNNIVAVDEDKRDVYYIARSGEGPGLAQLHRVSLDGKRDVRLTDPKLSHRIQMSPKFEAFVDVAERNDVPPITQVMDSKGKVIAELARSDLSKFEELKLKKSETVSFTAADGKTKCYGTLDFPSDFDPAKKYPLIVSVYAGPESGGGFERFQTPDTITEFGFLTASFDGRGTKGRGKAFKDAVYGKLGIVEIDDQAAGVKELAKRPYVDGKRVGVHGTSYGGYASAMALLRHPTVFKAAAASSSVTSWVHYDSIYTERYMGLPWDGENKEGYENGSAMKYAKDLKGRLLLYFGTADNNVHPSNTMQLAQALERAGKGFDMSVGPDRGHTGVNFSKMLEFFIENLILDQPADVVKLAWKSQAKSRIVLGR